MHWVRTPPLAPSVCKNDIDIMKTQLVSLEGDIRMLEILMGSAHNQLEDLGDWVDGFIKSIRKASSISETNNQSLGLEIQRVQRETRGHLEGLFQKFNWVNSIINKKIIHQDEEMDKVIDLVGQKIDAKMGEFSSNLMEALEIEENRQKDLETKVSGLERGWSIHSPMWLTWPLFSFPFSFVSQRWRMW
jgi:hypothetical protein